MADNESKFRVTLEYDQATNGFRIVEQAAKKTEDAVKKTGESFSKLDTGAVALGSTFGTLAGGAIAKVVSALAQMPGAINSALKEAQQVEGLTRSFENLQNSIGKTATESIGQLRAATQGLVSDVQLMQQANQAVLLGLPTQGFDQMAAAAVKLGQATGRTATEALNDLIIGVGRGSKLILDNLGILVDADAAYVRYAASIRKATSELTDQERKLAFQQEALRAISDSANKLAGTQETAGVAAGRLTAALENQKNAALQAFSENENLRDAINQLAAAISSVNVKPLIDGLAEIVSWAGKAIAVLTEMAGAISRAFDPLAEIRAKFEAVVGPAENVQKKLDNLKDSLGHISSEADLLALRPKFEELGKLIGGIADKGIKEKFSGAILDLNQKALQLQGAFQKINEGSKRAFDLSATQIKDFASQLSEIIKLKDEGTIKDKEYAKRQAEIEAAFKKAGGSAERFADLLKNQLTLAHKGAAKEAENQRKKLDELRDANGIIGVTNEIARLSEAYAEGVLNSQEYGASIDQLKTKLSQAGVEAGRVGEIIKKGISLGSDKALGSSSDLLKGSAPSGDSSFLGSLLGQFGIGSSGGGLKRTDVQGPLTKADTDALEASVQAQTDAAVNAGLAAGFQQAFDSLMQNGFDRSAVRGVSRGAGQAGGAAIGGYFGGEIGAQIGAQIGEAAGNAVGKWLEKLGQDSEGTKGRKALDKYFADLFDKDHLMVVINGQLSQIKDLQFLGNQEGGGIFAGLSDQAKTEFEGVGKAFEEMFDIAGDLGVNFGQVLANNLGGDLNNLQLLVEATGKSFDELSEKIIQAFLIGDESILNTIASLQALNGVMGKGIPGAVGAVDQAFKKVFTTGANGGRVLLDAIQDVAFEAQEMGVKDFPNLQRVLINVFGQSAEQVKIFFEAMRVAGVNSMQDLLNASTETLIAVAGNVEKAKAGLTQDITAESIGATRTNTSSGGGGSSRSIGSSSTPKPKPADKFKDVFLSYIPDLSQAAVRGIDDALAELVKLEDKAKGTFTKDLFNQFKLGMNDLQVAADRLGFSFKEMQEQAVKSFLAGKTTASEAAKAIQQSGQGIPDVIGGITEAVANLQKFGTKGGAFSLDALRDIGAEAGEAGIKGLDKDTRDRLIKERATKLLIGRQITKDLQNLANEEAAKQIDAENDPFAILKKKIGGPEAEKLFAQFQKFGIDTIDEIKNVSNEVGIQILGGLEQTGFAFKETDSQVTKLLDQLDKVEKAREITIKVNVTKGQIDKDSAKLLKEAGYDPREFYKLFIKNKKTTNFKGEDGNLSPGVK